MDGKVMEVHEFMRVRKVDLELGGDNFKRREFNDWAGWLMGDFNRDFDVCPPGRPSQVFWCLCRR